MATPPILSSLIAGNNSNGKESSTQYFVIMGATLVSMNVRTCFTTASSSAGKDANIWEKTGMGGGNAFLFFFVGVPPKISLLPVALRVCECTTTKTTLSATEAC